MQALLTHIRSAAPGTIAVSGGLDSRLLSHVAKRLGAAMTCLHISGPHLTPDESAAARAWLEDLGLPFQIITVDPLRVPGVADNGPERCYHCKHHLFTAARSAVPNGALLDGTNASDHGEYRPGLRALAALGVRSPFAEAGITKDDIHTLARALSLPRPDQPARPCLLTRFPYGVRPTPALLARLGELEDRLTREGWTDFRVRVEEGGGLRLHAHPANTGRPVPEDLPVTFTAAVSGHFDRASGLGKK